MSISQATSITIGGKKVASIYIGGRLVYPLNRSYHWEDRTSPGAISYGAHVWTDGVNTYHSYNGNTKQLVNNEWEDKTFNISITYGGNVYHTSWGDTYLLQDTFLYKLVNGTWVDEGLTDSTSRNGGLWDDGEHLYYSFYSFQQRYNTTTHMFEQISFVDSPLTSFRGESVFRYNGDIYCGESNGDIYVLDKVAFKWVKSTLSDSRMGTAQNIWTHNGTLYYSYNGMNLVLKNGAWVLSDIPCKGGVFNGGGTSVWHDKNNTYYSTVREQYVLLG